MLTAFAMTLALVPWFIYDTWITQSPKGTDYSFYKQYIVTNRPSWSKWLDGWQIFSNLLYGCCQVFQKGIHTFNFCKMYAPHVYFQPSDRKRITVSMLVINSVKYSDSLGLSVYRSFNERHEVNRYQNYKLCLNDKQ